MSRGGELRERMPGTLHAVEAFCRRFREWHRGACDGQDAFAAELLLREALVNGVLHSGCRGEVVDCVVRGDRRRVLIAVQDRGEGFDWRVQRTRQAAPGDAHGRGLAIYYEYADRVRFNARGNGVMLLRWRTRERKERA